MRKRIAALERIFTYLRRLRGVYFCKPNTLQERTLWEEDLDLGSPPPPPDAQPLSCRPTAMPARKLSLL